MALRTMNEKLVDEVRWLIEEALDEEFGGELLVKFGPSKINEETGWARLNVRIRPEAFDR